MEKHDKVNIFFTQKQYLSKTALGRVYDNAQG